MKLPYSWLQEMVDGLPAPAEAAALLTMRGFEIEEFSSPGAAIQDILVAKILALKPHPNADKLTLCDVTDGSRNYAIVCGASNMKAGDCVALAQIGTVLPGNFKLEKRKIRGIYSEGMLCSTRELGLGDDHAGIMILPPDAPLGRRLVDFLGLNDTLFEINVTPNRPDALCALGIARELAAACGQALRGPEVTDPAADVELDYVPSVELRDGDLCPRYTARVIRDVRVGSSPGWLVKRLEACGLRSVNNVVDATNLVLMELGQPLHAFDLDQLEEKRIVVRRARAGERIRTIDGEDRALDETMLAICDAARPVAVAGVMGGQESEVSAETTSILLESAYFDPPCIRRTSKKLGLGSEASYRFERGVDFETVNAASHRCARLIAELTGGRIAGRLGIADTADAARLEHLRGRDMTLHFAYCNRLLGQTVPPERIETIFASLQIPVKKRDVESITVRIPSFRQDITLEADLVEEVARCHGYNEFTPTILRAPVKPPEPQEVDRELVKQIRQFFVSQGLDEAVTYSFTDPELLGAFPREEAELDHPAATIQNPINVREAAMRSSLLPSLLQSARRNITRGNQDFGLFEIAAVYLASGETTREKKKIGVVILGNPHAGWRDGRPEFDFFDIKGLLENLFSLCGLKRCRLLPGPECLHPKRGVTVDAVQQTAGYFGELHPALAESYELPGRVLVAELDLLTLTRFWREADIAYRPYSIFPAVKRDLALLLPRPGTSRQVEDIIRQEAGALLEDLRLFDYYQGQQVAEGTVSLGFRLTFRSPEGTLTESDIDAMIGKILSRLKKELDVQLRS
ncbi:MAG: phenylalanine--tRNA ligase subunit beta [bacterium]